MYTLFNTKSVWPQAVGAPGQVIYGAVPSTPFIYNPHTMPPSTVYYHLQPTWVATPAPHAGQQRMSSSDDVFLSDAPYVYDKQFILMPSQPSCDRVSSAKPKRQPGNTNSGYKSFESVTFESHSGNTSNGSPVSSSQNTSNETSRGHYRTPTKLCYFSENSSNVSSDSNQSSPSSQQKDDSMIHSLFPASLCAALNEDPPEPKSNATPKTSSPIHDGEESHVLFDLSKLRKRRGRFITSSSSEKCPRFSENGVSEDLDQCDKILLQSRTTNSADEQAKKREEFLLILEAERERQKKLVLPKHTPKMSCKFCKNNGESPEVYTKHRLHYNEKTVCPLLRHYVCRLCNSTGDFAHTIRHCPFNDKKDKIAWRATFLV